MFIFMFGNSPSSPPTEFEREGNCSFSSDEDEDDEDIQVKPMATCRDVVDWICLHYLLLINYFYFIFNATR